MKIVNRILLLCALSATALTCGVPAAGAGTYPKIVLYTAWYCNSCKAAGDYLTQNHIPFTKKDVDLNEEYLQELSRIYRINAVPVIVIGNNDKVLRGFNRDVFDKAVQEVMAKTK
jgi:glutaredoxin 3